MSDHVPAPSADELTEFETLALEAPKLSREENAGALHNQFRLVVPRLVREIRRLRDLTQLQSEREKLQDEKAKRFAPKTVNVDDYTAGLSALHESMRRNKPDDERTQ